MAPTAAAMRRRTCRALKRRSTVPDVEEDRLDARGFLAARPFARGSAEEAHRTVPITLDAESRAQATKSSAGGSAPQFGDRRSYQMDPANADEALREVAAETLTRGRT